jgi:hypothetical protein
MLFLSIALLFVKAETISMKEAVPEVVSKNTLNGIKILKNPR